MGQCREIVCFFFSLLKCIIVIVIGASVADFNALDFSFARSPFFYDFNVISLLLFQFLCSIKRRENEDVTRFLLIFLLFFFALSPLAASLQWKKRRENERVMIKIRLLWRSHKDPKKCNFLITLKCIQNEEQSCAFARAMKSFSFYCLRRREKKCYEEVRDQWHCS